MSILQTKEDCVYIGNVPRHLIRTTVTKTRYFVFGSPRERFSAELDWLTLAGLIWGGIFGKPRGV
jgi:hypothetical protein